MSKLVSSLDEAKTVLQQGGIIAYPTEAIYGLGCDPFNREAVQRLFHLKQRPLNKGMILIIARWEQLAELIDVLPEAQYQRVKKTWPGPTTWIFNKSVHVPDWVTAGDATIAIRMTAHPIARALCNDIPLISTSANLSGHLPARNLSALDAQFPQGIDAIVPGELGGLDKPSSIFNALTGEQLR